MKRFMLTLPTLLVFSVLGCRAPMPDVNPYLPFGSTTVPAAPTGTINGAGTPQLQPPPGTIAPTAPGAHTGASYTAPANGTLANSPGAWRPAGAPAPVGAVAAAPAPLPTAPAGLATPIGTGYGQPVANYAVQDPADQVWFPSTPNPYANSQFAPPAVAYPYGGQPTAAAPHAGMPTNAVVPAATPSVPNSFHPSGTPVDISQLPAPQATAIAPSTAPTSGMRGYRTAEPIQPFRTTAAETEDARDWKLRYIPRTISSDHTNRPNNDGEHSGVIGDVADAKATDEGSADQVTSVAQLD